jgi:membrane-associated HD superfamily phosphohydrolase
MGDRVARLVREHHGTTTMRYFEEKAKALGGKPGEPGETYRYDGPRPQSREAGIVMIADQLEATARSSPPTDESQCADLVSRTVQHIVDEGQLVDVRLTSTQLAQASQALARSLLAMHHRRISYPGAPDGSAGRWSAGRLLSGRRSRP